MSENAKSKREQAFDLYKQHKGKIDLVEIARLVESPPGTVRGWKSKDKWDDKLGGTFQPKKRNAPKKKAERSKSEQPKMIIENEDLKEAEKMFCLYYLDGFNATKAYRRAYPDATYATARTEGSAKLAKPDIKKEIHRLKAQLQQDTFIDAKDLVQEYIRQAFADLSDFVDFGTEREVEIKATGRKIASEEVDDEGLPIMVDETKEIEYHYSFVRLKNSDEVDGRLIQEVKKGKDGVSVKLHDKQKAMVELMKYLNGDELRQAQINNLRAKIADGNEEPEIDDDGFLAALESKGEMLWPSDE